MLSLLAFDGCGVTRCAAVASSGRPLSNVDNLNINESKDTLFPSCNGAIAMCYESASRFVTGRDRQ